MKCSLTKGESREKMKGKDKIDSLAGSSSLSDQRKQFQKLYIVTALLYITFV